MIKYPLNITRFQECSKVFIFLALLGIAVGAWHPLFGQSGAKTRALFFEDTAILNVNITTDMGKLLRQKKSGYQFPGTFATVLPDGTIVNDTIQLDIRGHFRKDYCYLPPVSVNFKYKKSAVLYKLGSLKLVNECKTSSVPFEQYLIKEFLVYKIYNLLTDLSFRVRLVRLNFVDEAGKKKNISEYAFLLEDLKDLAKRNNCSELKTAQLSQESTNRRQMTLVAIFEYMIGNLDWGVPVNHNTRLILPKSDSSARPFVIPYDFDYSGFVNTDYALPPENLDVQNVQERLYRGFARPLTEINGVLGKFKTQKDTIYNLINHYPLLTNKSKKDLIGYLDDFYKTVSNPQMVENVFIKNARGE